jgi:hypothetical protein
MEDAFLAARFLLSARVDVGEGDWTVREPPGTWHRLRAALVAADAERRLSSLFTVPRRETPSTDYADVPPPRRRIVRERLDDDDGPTSPAT